MQAEQDSVLQKTDNLVLGFAAEEVRLFVGPGAGHYLKAFKGFAEAKDDAGKSKPGLNFPALLAGLLLSFAAYLVYRKMYWYALGWLVLQLTILAYGLLFPSDSIRGLFLLSYLIFPFCSDRIYASFVSAKLNRLNAANPKVEDRPRQIAQAGGVNPLAALGYLAVLAVFAYWLFAGHLELLQNALSHSL